jgi:transcriptional regulator with XRE-family HTH domain
MARHGVKGSIGEDLSASEVFAERLREVREWHRGPKRESLSQAGLAQRLERIGHPIHRSRIAKLESGEARPKLDDVLAIAVVLNVSPLFLIVPPLGSKLRIGKEAISPQDARAWIAGKEPLPGQLPAAFAAQQPDDQIPLEYRDVVKAYRPPKQEEEQ